MELGHLDLKLNEGLDLIQLGQITNGLTSCQINYMYIVPMITILYNVLGNGDLCV